METKSVIDALDDLLDSALAQQATERAQRRVRTGPREHAPKAPPSWQDPATWTGGAFLALIHRDGDALTLLGNFQEFHHSHLPRARRLIRVSEAHPVSRTELVEGDWWLSKADEERRYGYEEWSKKELVRTGITLAEFCLHAPDCAVLVHTHFGGIYCVELAEDTRFGCPSRSTFLLLPSGLDILGAMDRDSKILLKAELAPEEDDDELDS